VSSNGTGGVIGTAGTAGVLFTFVTPGLVTPDPLPTEPG
jgi:hypothetical protein